MQGVYDGRFPWLHRLLKQVSYPADTLYLFATAAARCGSSYRISAGAPSGRVCAPARARPRGRGARIHHFAICIADVLYSREKFSEKRERVQCARAVSCVQAL